ncbi:unnamed protein product [Schistosoma mattheei]|uniref:Uncharacterized protein n=1 Tax=Schistosoma mattheei TaxID=31246 RepID=A0A183P194_9TREM|nr:unnamed protein product [Schistosoma mattheei]
MSKFEFCINFTYFIFKIIYLIKYISLNCHIANS